MSVFLPTFLCNINHENVQVTFLIKCFTVHRNEMWCVSRESTKFRINSADSNKHTSTAIYMDAFTRFLFSRQEEVEVYQ